MITPVTFSTASAAASARVDSVSGTIKGVSVITEGNAKGHGLVVDATTLEQVRTAAAAFTGGLKVKMDHGSGAADIVGVLRNFTTAGKALRADLHLLQTSPHRAYLLELASTAPQSFGLSISFSGQSETRGAVKFARCSEIYSADIVDEPAANPTGLFSSKPALTDQKFEDLIAHRRAEGDDLADAIRFCIDHHPAAHADFIRRTNAGERVSLDRLPVTKNATLETIVAQATVKRDMSKAAAIAWAVKNHPEAHREFLARTYSGQRIAL